MSKGMTTFNGKKIENFMVIEKLEKTNVSQIRHLVMGDGGVV